MATMSKTYRLLAVLLAAVFVSYRAGERFERSLTQQRLGVVR